MTSNSSNSNRSSGGGRNESGSKFCAVCSAAGRSDYNTHYVRADKYDRNSSITCPYLMSIQCRMCGQSGHTAGYCQQQSRRSSSSAAAAVRLPPISRTTTTATAMAPAVRAPPRIVFETHDPQQRRQLLPPLKFVPRATTNDEPLLRRGPAEASPVHSPAKPRPRSNNPFSALESSSDSSDTDYYSPVAKQPPRLPDSSPESVGRCRGVSDVKEWPSLPSAAAAHKPTLARVVAKGGGGGQPVLPPLPPIIFKKKSNSKLQKNKLWGDTDSEDDEEFLKRGLE